MKRYPDDRDVYEGEMHPRLVRSHGRAFPRLKGKRGENRRNERCLCVGRLFVDDRESKSLRVQEARETTTEFSLSLSLSGSLFGFLSTRPG